ncbi:aldehyde ferredoxin oxidoreductase family protein [Dehalococcoidia bacterium]|nr:aldehyde ferredoxin oxidoreductase family protein [Dehalococcoidia bacterium]
MTGGFHGRMLDINLSDGKIEEFQVEEDDLRKYFGGSGLACRMLHDEGFERIDPLAPESKLFMISGLLTGTPTPTACKMNLCARSPLTGIWGEAVGGGHWPAAFHATGYDGIVFSGRSSGMVYLLMDNDKAEIRDGSHLRGLDTFETHDRLKEEHGRDFRVACIGPAGERGVRFASLMIDGLNARATGRCGMGTVMGSKNLKAVVVRGNRRPPVHDRKRLIDALKEDIASIKENSKGLSEFGTAGGVLAVEQWGDLPVKNWLEGSWREGAEKITAQTTFKKYLVKHESCWACPIGCGKIIKVEEGPFAPVYGHAPEYETLGGFGGLCMNDNYESIARANEICNRLGMDTISASAMVGFAIEAYENGIIGKEDTGGLELGWGKSMEIVRLTEKIGLREDIGDLLAEGVRAAAARLGPLAQEFAIHTKGLEFPLHDPRAFVSMGGNYATANRGACHLEALTYFLARGIPCEDLGITEPPNPHVHEGKSKILYDMQNFQAIFNPLGLCKFLFLARVGPRKISRWIELVTGWKDYSMEELMESGERLFNLKRMYNVRLGISRKDDTLPPRLGVWSRKDGFSQGSLTNLGKMLDEYYILRGWNEYGLPTEKKLGQLGLSFLVEKLPGTRR